MLVKNYKEKYGKTDYSIINFSKVRKESRIDAEYWEPFWILLEKKIERLNHKPLYELASNKYKTFNPKLYEKFYYIEISDIDLLTGSYEAKSIPYSKAPLRAKKMVEENDILISTVRPNRNAVAFIPKLEQEPLVASTGFCKLQVINDLVIPAYLFVLFKTTYYKNLLVRMNTASMYPAILEKDIMKLKIPIPSLTFQRIIEKFVLKSYEERKKAKKFYKEAEGILLERFQLKDCKPKIKKLKVGNEELKEEENISIRMFSDIIKSNRMDAEYWEPKYDRFLDHLNMFAELEPLKSFLASPIQKGIEVGGNNYQEDGIPFIRVSNITPFGVIERDQKYISEETYFKFKDQYEPKKGEILLTKDATPGIAYVLKENLRGIISSGIVRLKVKGIEKEYLSLVMNSMIGRMQVLREGGGSIISHWKQKQIENLLIPKIDPQTQQRISQLINQSFKARENSKLLLKIAKKTVETYIELDEKTALEFAKKHLKEVF